MTGFHALAAWLSASLSGAPHAPPAAWIAWHGRLMVAGWTILLPLGMLIARFFKVTPSQDWPRVVDRKVWWRSHLGFQSAGLLAATAGLVLAFGRGSAVGTAAFWHHAAGWTVLGCGWLQLLSGLLRGSKGGPTTNALRGDHYDMTPRRVAFERIHKSLGWAVLPIVVATTAMGLGMADAPRWMALLIGLWWIGFAAAFAWLQASGRCIDTYQAIWGVDPVHPGNARRPIGWGVRKYPASSTSKDKQRRPCAPA